LTARPIEDEAKAVMIAAGEMVRLVPEYATTATAHVIWQERHFAVERETFLQGCSPLGPAPD
jgi:hypothetical protein